MMPKSEEPQKNRKLFKPKELSISQGKKSKKVAILKTGLCI